MLSLTVFLFVSFLCLSSVLSIHPLLTCSRSSFLHCFCVFKQNHPLTQKHTALHSLTVQLLPPSHISHHPRFSPSLLCSPPPSFLPSHPFLQSSHSNSRDYAKPWLAHSKTPTATKCHCCPDHSHSTPGHEVTHSPLAPLPPIHPPVPPTPTPPECATALTHPLPRSSL